MTHPSKLCECCIRLFQIDGLDQYTKPVVHHRDIASFASSINSGCVICKSLFSEANGGDGESLGFASGSYTECLVNTTRQRSKTLADHFGSDTVYKLVFFWRGHSTQTYNRNILLVPSQNLQPFLAPLDPRGSTWVGRARIATAQHWINECMQNHPKCQVVHRLKTSESTFWPKRLVDIGVAGDTTWRLVARDETVNSKEQYATLSHRWSPKQISKLLQQNFHTYKNGLPLASLPQGFQDAISVARSLGLKYLWIDCLCIIQDSIADWETESLEMRMIYANSVCNICATGVPDNSSGFLAQVEGTDLPLPPSVQPAWAPQVAGGWSIVDPFFWWSDVTNKPLLRRGWVFQERFLAPRVIHFGSDQMLWECTTLDACEVYPKGLPLRAVGHTGFKSLDIIFDESVDQSTTASLENQSVYLTNEDLLRIWCDVVESYSRTSLSKSVDKLIALAGVAEFIFNLHALDTSAPPGRYVAGIFSNHFIPMLEWHAVDVLRPHQVAHRPGPGSHAAPSWSWASINGRVFYEYLPEVMETWQHSRRGVTWGRLFPEWNKTVLRPKRDRQGQQLLRSTPLALVWARWLPQMIREATGANENLELSVPEMVLGWLPLVTDITDEIHYSTASRFGQVSHGHIELTGLILPARQLLNSPTVVAGNCGLTGNAIVYYDEEPPPARVTSATYCLPLRCIKFRSTDLDVNYWVTGLILNREPSDLNTYKRIGLFCIHSARAIQGAGINISNNTFAVTFSKTKDLKTIRIT
ncbi:heterokaryon incompatibility protein-domain-containing protein [Xylariales sp. PMI_506]|nr:heterokaryon incompatibility protein-domain-containing protein [Xylariales sp. PMI_506]